MPETDLLTEPVTCRTWMWPMPETEASRLEATPPNSTPPTPLTEARTAVLAPFATLMLPTPETLASICPPTSSMVTLPAPERRPSKTSRTRVAWMLAAPLSWMSRRADWPMRTWPAPEEWMRASPATSATVQALQPLSLRSRLAERPTAPCTAPFEETSTDRGVWITTCGISAQVT